MKFKWWKKENDKSETGNENNFLKDKSDVSIFYDYDKIAHNQFLTNDKIVRSNFVNPVNQTRSYSNVKDQNMLADNMAFDSINKSLKQNAFANINEFNTLKGKSSDILSQNKIPLKKKGSLFGKKEEVNCFQTQVDSSSNYNIIDNQEKKYENKINFNSLRNDQTKLLNLDEVFNENNNKVEKVTTTQFNINQNNLSNLTNRLFVNNEVEKPSQSSVISDVNVEEKKQIIPTKTIKFVFNQQAQQEETIVNEPKTSSWNLNSLDYTKNYSIYNNVNNNNEINKEQPKRTPTTALRYLVPVEEDLVEDKRIAKENRRIIKYKE